MSLSKFSNIEYLKKLPYLGDIHFGVHSFPLGENLDDSEAGVDPVEFFNVVSQAFCLPIHHPSVFNKPQGHCPVIDPKMKLVLESEGFGKLKTNTLSSINLGYGKNLIRLMATAMCFNFAVIPNNYPKSKEWTADCKRNHVHDKLQRNGHQRLCA